MPKNLDFYRGGQWNPLQEVSSLHRGIERLFDDFFEVTPPELRSEMMQAAFNPAVDVHEEDKHYLVSMDLPGVKKEDVKIEVRERQLVVSGERKSEKREEGKGRSFTERSYGRFERSFTLPAAVNADQIEADFENGVLKIAIPKAEEQKSKFVQIGQKAAGFLGKKAG